METIKLFARNNTNERLACELNKSVKNSNLPTILILHALTGKKENRTINFLAKTLPEYGFNTIQFDFSGHGESEGKMEEATVTKQLGDIDVVLSQIKQISTNKIILIGNSFSVITSLAFAANTDSVIGLILLSGRANYLKYIDTLEKEGKTFKLADNIFVGEGFIEDYKKYNPLQNLNHINVPVLIIHGEKDEIIPKEDAIILYDNSASKHKEIGIITGADHRYSEQKYKDELLDLILHFLKNLETNHSFKNMELAELLAQFKIKTERIIHAESGKTTLQAVAALSENPGNILKSLLLKSKHGKFLGIILSGDKRADLHKVEEYCKSNNLEGYTKLRLALADEVKDLLSYEVGGVPPFAFYGNCIALFDSSLLSKAYVIGAGGNEFTGLKFNPSDLLKLGFLSADICKDESIYCEVAKK